MIITCPRCNDNTWVIHDGMFHWHCPVCGTKDTDIKYTMGNKTERLDHETVSTGTLAAYEGEKE
jgi:ribosomal protein L37AE/L43A